MRYGRKERNNNAAYVSLCRLMLVVTVLISPNVFGVQVKQVIEGDHIETSAGVIKIDQVRFEDGSCLNHVFLNEKVIFDDQCGESLIQVEAIYPATKAAQLVLISTGGSGSSCPTFLRVLNVNEVSTRRVSFEFGNCLPPADPKYFPKIMENPVYRDGEWHIALPVPGSDSKEVVWYVYSDGRVTKDQKKLKRP